MACLLLLSPVVAYLLMLPRAVAYLLLLRFSYWSRSHIQEYASEEMTVDVRNLAIEALKEFFKRNQVLPDKVIVYRDGVGEGQLQVCDYLSSSTLMQPEGGGPMAIGE